MCHDTWKRTIGGVSWQGNRQFAIFYVMIHENSSIGVYHDINGSWYFFYVLVITSAQWVLPSEIRKIACFGKKCIENWKKLQKSLEVKKKCLPLQSQTKTTRLKPKFWCHSSVGRAKDWKSLCPWFDSRWHHNKTAIEVLLLRFFVVFASILYHYMYNCFATSCNYIFEFDSSGNCKIGLLCTSIPLLKIFSTDFW